MRIIGGYARGIRLSDPDGWSLRPTEDRVKETVFSMLGDISGMTVADLFSGTGAMGLEALSRGAASLTFVDESREAINLVRENLKTVGFQAKTVQSNALDYLSRKEKFDLIFLDPPYDSTLLEKSLEKIAAFDKLNEGGIIICESSANKVLPELPEPYSLVKSYRYGKTKITLYVKAER